MKMKRRPKGMGCVAFLGTGRRKPYVATLKKKCIGTFKSEADAQKALLGVVLNPVSYTHLLHHPAFYNNVLPSNR